MANADGKPNIILARIPSWITPNHLTLAHILLSIPMVLGIMIHWYWTAGILFAIGGICDIFDGALARARGIKTETGAFLDPLADKMMNVCALLAFWFDDFFLIISESANAIILGVVLCTVAIATSLTVVRLFILTQSEQKKSVAAVRVGKAKMWCESVGLGFAFLASAVGQCPPQIIFVVISAMLLAIALVFAGLSLAGQLKKV
jgi:phosphatidylglycerophosphate synthase